MATKFNEHNKQQFLEALTNSIGIIVDSETMRRTKLVTKCVPFITEAVEAFPKKPAQRITDRMAVSLLNQQNDLMFDLDYFHCIRLKPSEWFIVMFIQLKTKDNFKDALSFLQKKFSFK